MCAERPGPAPIGYIASRLVEAPRRVSVNVTRCRVQSVMQRSESSALNFIALRAERPAPAAIPYTASRLVEGLTGGHNPSGDGGSPSKAEELCEDKLMVM